MTGPAIPQENLDYFWNVVVLPRIGTAVHRADAYDWGGSFSSANVDQGTDCSGAVSTEASAMVRGPGCIYPRQFYTGTFAGVSPGERGPFGGVDDTRDWVCIAGPGDAPPDACMTIAIRQMADPTDAHMICRVQGIDIEMGGGPDNYHTSVSDTRGATIFDTSEFDQWFYIDRALPSGASQPSNKPVVSDTIFADVSEFQVPLNDSYFDADYVAGNGVTGKYRWISIRSNDGGHTDANFPANYAVATKAIDDGRADGVIVYFYWRPGATDVNTHMSMVEDAGGPHPKMVSMMDIESGGNPNTDESQELDAEYAKLQAWLGNPKRVIGYANEGDRKQMWQFVPAHVPFILAGYGANPQDAEVFKIAHQYTNGVIDAGGLPMGAPPFGNCDMNSADGFSPDGLAVALGIATDSGGGDDMANVPQDEWIAVRDKILGPAPDHKWPSRGLFVTSGEGVDDTVGMLLNIDGNGWNGEVILGVLLGVEDDIQMVKDAAAGKFPADSFVSQSDWLKARATSFAKALLPLAGLLPQLASGAPAAKKAPAKKAPVKRSS